METLLTLKSLLRGLHAGINLAASTAVVIISTVDSSLLGGEIRMCDNRNRHLVAKHRHIAIAQHSIFTGDLSCQTPCAYTQKMICKVHEARVLEAAGARATENFQFSI